MQTAVFEIHGGKGNDEVSGRIVLWPIRLMAYRYGRHLRAHLTTAQDLRRYVQDREDAEWFGP